MADFDNGLPPYGTDISGDSVSSVNITGAVAEDPEIEDINSVNVSSSDYEEPELENIKGVFVTSEESEDTSFPIQVFCDEAWVMAEWPEWIWPDTLAGNGNGTIHIAVYKNTGHERTGIIVVQTIDGLAKATHTVTQEAGGTVYIANINMTLAANPEITSGQLLLRDIKVNRHDSELIEEVGPFNVHSGKSERQAISYSSLEPKPDAVTCTVWVANITPVPANRQVNILSAGVLVGTIITDANGIGSMEMAIPIVNTDMDNYTMDIQAVVTEDYVTLDPAAHQSPGAGDTFTLRVTSNARWSIYDLPAWAHADITSGGDAYGVTVTDVHITVDANSGGPRFAPFSVITDSAVATAYFQLFQNGA
ncbi:BACON domain-containing protein [Dysgonomonas termitidis]|uniref:BACON domain-containing protein n=1 Tax=Dysgonomonas termitidis TaxID=1516126 RepID=A0ABV9KPV1_9BACT